MKRPLFIALATIAASVMLLSVFAFRRYLPYTGIDFSPKEPPAIVLAMDDVYFEGVGNNGVLWCANAKRMEIGRNRSLTTFTNIDNGKIFDKKKPVLSIEAGMVTYDTFTKDLELSRGILIKGPKGQIIRGKGASWNSTTQTLRSIGQVNVEMKDSKLSAEKLLLDVKNRTLDMWNGRMTISIDDIAGMQEAKNGTR